MKNGWRIAFAALLIVAACDDGGGDEDAGTHVDAGGHDAGGHDAGGTHDSGTTPDAGGTDAGTTSDSGPGEDGGPMPDAGPTATLTVENCEVWCSVSVDGMTASSGATQTVEVPQGSVIDLSAEPISSTFVFGYWINTDGDTSGTHDRSMNTTVTVDGDTIVQVCCPFASAPGTPCVCPVH